MSSPQRPMRTPRERVNNPFNDEMVTEVIQKGWVKAGGKSTHREETTTLPAAKAGLKFVFHSLNPITQVPEDVWFAKVFASFDTKHTGLMTRESFEEIVRQFYEHCRDKVVNHVKDFFDERRRKDEADRDRHHGPGAAADSGGPSGQVPPKWVAASVIMCPELDGAAFRRNYDVLRTAQNSVVGRGSFGAVRIVQHKQTKVKRACKTINLHKPQVWKLALIEKEIMQKLDHPNICQLRETYTDANQMHLILELCEGGELLSRAFERRRQGVVPYKIEQVVSWMKQLLAALRNCHENDVVHRDVKPDNIMFVTRDEDSPIKLIDFGLAAELRMIKGEPVAEDKKGLPAIMQKVLRRPQKVARTMELAGTYYYMAPEVFDRYYDYKCDVFSSGIVMYQLISGQHPFMLQFTEKDEMEWRIKHVNPDFSLPQFNHVNDDCKKLLTWMLEKDPRKRCSAAEALSHNWFRSFETPVGQKQAISASVYEDLSGWQAHSEMKKAVCMLLAKSMNQKDIALLTAKFEAIDRDKTGYITIDQLKKEILKAKMDVGPETERSLRALVNAQGKIGYTDFIGALVASRVQFREPQLREIFDKFDEKGRGYLTTDDIRKIFKEQKGEYAMTPEEANAVLIELDTSGTDKLDFKDFVTIMCD